MEQPVASLELLNPRNDSIAPVVVPALADLTSAYLQIPEHICRQLRLETFESRDVRLPDGSCAIRYYVGPIVAHIGNRTGFMGAIVGGDSVRLGTLAIEEMDLGVDSRDGSVDVHAESPWIARGMVAGLTRSLRSAGRSVPLRLSA